MTGTYPCPIESASLMGPESTCSSPFTSTDTQIPWLPAVRWASGGGAHQRFQDVVAPYWEYGERTRIRPEVAYAQSALETHFGHYGGVVRPEQNNWAGIKTQDAAGDEPTDHESFPSPEEGVRGHFNHLAAYTGLQPIGEPHGRYHLVLEQPWAGSICCVEELGGRWAPAGDYGHRIVNLLGEMLAAEAPGGEFVTRGQLERLETRVRRLENALRRVTEVLQDP